ncbi:MAG: NAD-binding protein [Firmicutes bacterium]|nr:NAD-binding protein [Bacillota bacterium]
MFVIVVGGGKVGFYLTKTLIEAGHEVLLLEKDAMKARGLEDNFGDVAVQGDGTELATLQNVGASRADVVAAVTGHDEDNIVVCQMAKKLGCKRVIGRVNNPKNEDAFLMLDIKTTVNSTQLIYHLVEEQVGLQGIIPLLELRGGKAEIVELEISAGSPAVGKPVKELNLPEDCLLVSVMREEEIIFPRGETVLSGGDTVIALTARGKAHLLRDALIGSGEV